MESRSDIDQIIQLVKNEFPNVGVWQLEVTHPSDDNGIWYFWLGEKTDDEIQIENSSGNCPFLIETFRNDERRYSKTIRETTEIICEHLRTSKYNK